MHVVRSFLQGIICYLRSFFNVEERNIMFRCRKFIMIRLGWLWLRFCQQPKEQFVYKSFQIQDFFFKIRNKNPFNSSLYIGEKYFLGFVIDSKKLQIITRKDIPMKKIFSIGRNLLLHTKRSFSEISQFKNNFLSTTNVAYLESMYEKWLKDKKSVSPSFHAYFQSLQKGQDPEKAFIHPPNQGQKMDLELGSAEVRKQLGVRMMIDRYRAVAHQFAKTDPLEIYQQHQKLPGKLDLSALDIEQFGFSRQNMQDQIVLKYLREENSDRINGPYTIQAMEDYLRKVYTGKVGYEYTHVHNKEQRDFLKASIEKYIETLMVTEPTKEQMFETFGRLCKDQCFIDFLAHRFTNVKRFGIQGLNAVTSALGKLVQVAAQTGCQHIVMGMAHRGRINILHSVFQKSAQHMFREFLQLSDPDVNVASGDVKYHLGYLNRKNYKGNQIYMRMLPNPSHLQAVDPLVYGSVRAIQEFMKDQTRTKAMGVLIHGDAALTGQGSVYESLQFQGLVDYTTGGVIHIVMNNQLGFTTPPWQGRSSYYCTQIAKVIGAPVIHVNADEPDLLDGCMQVAVAYKQKFKKDIFIDIVGYRRHGHSEQDQPYYTHPKMYDTIRKHPSVFDLYSKKCIQKGVLTEKQIQEMKMQFMNEYQEAYKKVTHDIADDKPQHEDPYYDLEKVPNPQYKTGVPRDTLKEIFHKITVWPKNFNIHTTIKKIFEERTKNFNQGENIDWATMESLAFGTLIQEGFGVRLSGQDVERGTFSHRHAYISDQKRDVQKLNFFKCLSPEKVTICNSHLSEYGVCGYEYGYSITNPNVLVIWQAQFGDFANGAQIIIDNYMTMGESKWGIQTGLVLNLPHGMDGQGPEHSSGRIERFLFLSDDNCDANLSMKYEEKLQKCNIQVVSCSTSANYFHVLRRQLRRDFRKPLINFNSKRLLKFRLANSSIKDILEGTQFTPVYPDPDVKDPKKITRVLLCNGQFYYDLKAKRDELKKQEVAIIRIEQIAPFPHEEIRKAVEVYGKDVHIDWAQEEHENYGAGNFLIPRLKKLFSKNIKFFSRDPSSTTAAGALKLHKIQQAELMAKIFNLKIDKKEVLKSHEGKITKQQKQVSS